MKHTKHLIILSAVIVLLSSCGSLSIAQKRYSRGLNISWFSAKEDNVTKVAKPRTTKVKTIPVNVVPESEAVKPEIGDVSEIIEPAAPVVELAASGTDVNVINPIKQNQLKYQKQHKYINANIAIKSVQPTKKNQIKKAIKAAKANDVDIETILLVILCILLPPLAVFLYYMELNGQFWLNLLLYLLAAIAIFLLISKLFYLAAVIHALLVVLGMIG